MSKNLVTNLAGYCGVAIIGLTPYSTSASSDYTTLYAKYAVVNTQSNNSNTTNKTHIEKNIDLYELEANSIISEIEEKLEITIDDKFIPNKSENHTTLFITCKEFRDFCEAERYQEAMDLEKKISEASLNKIESNNKIGRIAFL